MGVPAPLPKGARRPSNVAYYVALVGILSLLIMLCLYFFYYFIKKVKELSSSDALSLPTASCRPPPAPSAYPVQPVVRDSASAMAKLCKQVPAAGKGDTVFPTSTSPAALRASTGEGARPPGEGARPPGEGARPPGEGARLPGVGARSPGEPAARAERPPGPGSDARPDKPPAAPLSAAPDVAAR